MKINIMAEKFGYVTQVIGPVVDVIFEKDGEENNCFFIRIFLSSCRLWK